MGVNGKYVPVILAVSCLLLCDASIAGTQACNEQLSQDEAINLLAEGAARGKDDKPMQAVIDRSVVEDAKRVILDQLKKGWVVGINQANDCSFSVSFTDPRRWPSGFSIGVDQNKQVTSFLFRR